MRIGSVNKKNRGVAAGSEGSANLNDEACVGITLCVEGQLAARGGCNVKTINARGKSHAAEILVGQVIGRRGSQAGEVAVGGGEVGVSLGRGAVIGMECAVDDDAGRESGDSGAWADSDVAGDYAGARISDGSSP